MAKPHKTLFIIDFRIPICAVLLCKKQSLPDRQTRLLHTFGSSGTLSPEVTSQTSNTQSYDQSTRQLKVQSNLQIAFGYFPV